MNFNLVSIFPGVFKTYFDESILGSAQKKKIIKINTFNPRDFTSNKHKKVDDTPYGGGAGMVMQVEPIHKCVEYIKKKNKNKKTRIILLSAKGKEYTQRDAKRLSEYENLILICGRYEGVDERVVSHIADEEISIGKYVLTGGELPAMILVDSISRLVSGVLGNPESIKEESFFNDLGKKEHPQYTKPEVYNNWNVPEILLSGNHQEIKKWREEHS